MRVGLIGVNAERGWAATAHIPALKALPDYEILALSTTNQRSADAAGLAFDVPRTYSDHEALVESDDIDLVVVTVKAPRHHELVMAALGHGKAVYCEWPLGASVPEAIEMAELAGANKLACFVGLQARHAPIIEYVRDLVSDGYVGTVLSSSMIGASSTGASVSQANAYMLDESNGANLLTVAFGHSLDALSLVLGETDWVGATMSTLRSSITVTETAERLDKTAPDQVAVVGRLRDSGGVSSMHFREALAGGTGFLWEINGTDGTLRITADAGLPGIFPMRLTGASGSAEPTELPVPVSYAGADDPLSGLGHSPAYNVGRMYSAYASDVRSGSRSVPDFEHAVTRQRDLAGIRAMAT